MAVYTVAFELKGRLSKSFKFKRYKEKFFSRTRETGRNNRAKKVLPGGHDFGGWMINNLRGFYRFLWLYKVAYQPFQPALRASFLLATAQFPG